MCNLIKICFNHICTYRHVYYWWLLTIVSSLYILNNWEEITSFTFFNDFDGKNLLFIAWLTWLLLPLVHSFKFAGAEVNMRNSEEKEVSSLVEQLNIIKKINTEEDKKNVEHV